jgi:hypothetical protein
LLQHGFRAILAEFAGLKCDDPSARKGLEAFAAGEIPRSKVPAPRAPMSLWNFQANLMAMGLYVEIADGGAPTLCVRPATRREMVAVSQGQVRKPDTLNYRTYEGEPGGLFCPTIFGDRVTRFGHVELAAPIVPFWAHAGAPSMLEQVLSLTGEQIESLVKHRQFVRPHSGALEWGDIDVAQTDPQSWLTGGAAILWLLDHFPIDNAPLGLSQGAGVLVPTFCWCSHRRCARWCCSTAATSPPPT